MTDPRIDVVRVLHRPFAIADRMSCRECSTYTEERGGTLRRWPCATFLALSDPIEDSTPHGNGTPMPALDSDALRIEALHAALGTTQPTASGAVNVTDVVKNAETYLAFLVGEAAK